MSTQLRELFDGAAESQPADGLAARAVAAARSRRRQRYTVAGSVLAAAAVVLGFVMVSSSERLDDAPRPDEVAGLPAELPSAQGLPLLTAESMDAASVAYIVDGEVVVIDSVTGEGAVVDLGPSGISYLGDELPSIGPNASLALSPSGEALLVASGETGLAERGAERLWLVDLATGRAHQQGTLSLADAPDNSAASPTRLAWSPDGFTFACTYLVDGGTSPPQLFTTDLARRGDDLVEVGGASYGVAPTQISWGTGGLVAQLEGMKAPWRLVPLGESTPQADPKRWPPLESVSVGAGAVPFSGVAMGHSDEGGFLAKLALGKGGSGSLWVVPEEGEYRTVESVPSRPWLGALGDSYFVVLTDWKGDPYNDEVDRVDFEGETTLTTLPPGSAAISFASDLVD